MSLFRNLLDCFVNRNWGWAGVFFPTTRRLSVNTHPASVDMSRSGNFVAFITNSKEHGLPWEANSRLASQEISRFLCNLKIRYPVTFVFLTALTMFSSVGIAVGCGLDDRGVNIRVPVGSTIFTSPYRPDRLWGPPNLLSNRYPLAFSREWSGKAVKLTTHLQLVQSSKKRGSIHPLLHTSSWRSA
jgi:hypothetical protein